MFSLLKPAPFNYTSLDHKSDNSDSRVHGIFKSFIQYWREVVILCLCAICSAFILENAFNPVELRQREKTPDYQLRSQDTRWRQFEWHTNIYSSADPQDDDAVNTAWDRIVPAFGVVAIDHEWAADHDLPGAMDLPSDSSKGVYILDAYHQIHCLTIIRKTLNEISAVQVPTVPLEHSRHCFDSLLQYIMCGTSGDTLLYTEGRNETGSGQLRKCIDWNSRKTWIRENSACYADSDHPISLNDHFGHCENDDDGIVLPGTW